MKKMIMFALAAMSVSVSACSNKAQSEEVAEPFFLLNCPSEVDGLKVELATIGEVGQKITIIKDGNLLLEVGGKEDDMFIMPDEFEAHVADINFDGENDVYVGAGGSDYKLFLWNPQTQKFEAIESEELNLCGNSYFVPSQKAIYLLNMASFCDMSYTKTTWDGKRFAVVNYLREVTDIPAYEEMAEKKNVKRFTILNSDGNDQQAFDDLESLPEEWKSVVKKFNAYRGIGSDEGDSAETTSVDNSEKSKIDFINAMYKDFFESGLIDSSDPTKLKKYAAPSVVEQLTVPGEYDGDDGTYYIIDFFHDGCPYFGRPDYGDKVVKRNIKALGDDWFEVENIWDVITKPVKVRFKLAEHNGSFWVSEIKVDESQFDIPDM